MYDAELIVDGLSVLRDQDFLYLSFVEQNHGELGDCYRTDTFGKRVGPKGNGD